jgi:predicted phage tail protein
MLGYIYGTDEFLQRYTTDYPMSFASWDGYYVNQSAYDAFDSKKDTFEALYTPVPSGEYVIRLRALKVFGDQNNEADWETWLSGPITIIQR